MFLCGLLYWSTWRDTQINNYWDNQMEVCHKVGYYNVGGGYCIPADELPKNNY